MDINYSGTYSDLGYACYWMTPEADFEMPSPPDLG